MITISTVFQTDLSLVHCSGRSISHSYEPVPTSTVCVSSPRPNAWDIDALIINWSGLTACADQNQVMQLPDLCNNPRLVRDALVLGPSAALNRDPSSATSVKNSSQTVSQLGVSQPFTRSQSLHLVSRSGQLQEQGFSVEVAERIAAPQRSSARTIYKSSGPYLRNGAENI